MSKEWEKAVEGIIASVRESKMSNEQIRQFAYLLLKACDACDATDDPLVAAAIMEEKTTKQ